MTTIDAPTPTRSPAPTPRPSRHSSWASRRSSWTKDARRSGPSSSTRSSSTSSRSGRRPNRDPPRSTGRRTGSATPRHTSHAHRPRRNRDRLLRGAALANLRLVGSILATPTERPDVISVSSSLLVYRQRGIDAHFDLIPCRRNDELRLTADGPRLLSREIILTEVALGTPNLGVFL